MKSEFQEKFSNDSPIFYRLLCAAFIGEVAREGSDPDSVKSQKQECCISPSNTLDIFEKVMEIYPFSVAEKKHMRSTLKAQVLNKQSIE